MPTRILREGILTSDKIDKLDYASEVFYRRLMSKVDDHGLFDARPSILRAALYPLKIDKIKDSNIIKWLQDCINCELIVIYTASDNKQYLKMLKTNWKIRSEPKFPEPTKEQLITTDNNCLQLCTYTYTDTKTKTKTYTYGAPSVHEVTMYAKSINFDLDGESFVNFYEAKGWMIGKNKMKDWKAAVRTWKFNQQKGYNQNAKNDNSVTPEPGKYSQFDN